MVHKVFFALGKAIILRGVYALLNSCRLLLPIGAFVDHNSDGLLKSVTTVMLVEGWEMLMNSHL